MFWMYLSRITNWQPQVSVVAKVKLVGNNVVHIRVFFISHDLVVAKSILMNTELFAVDSLLRLDKEFWPCQCYYLTNSHFCPQLH
jgi:hypothetical protein